jgi:hypothetical protein
MSRSRHTEAQMITVSYNLSTLRCRVLHSPLRTSRKIAMGRLAPLALIR